MRRLGGLITIVQIILALRVIRRMIGTVGGATIERTPEGVSSGDRVTVLIPVLNEESRLRLCLDQIIRLGSSVSEILVIDGGSTDATVDIVSSFAERDDRVQLIAYQPVDDGRNQKALQLQAGVDASVAVADWILTIDADVRVEPELADALVARGNADRLDALSAASLQRLSGQGEAIVHPSLLSTLVYRFGIPGNVFKRSDEVQANGQCFLVRSDALRSVGGFESVADSVCEDVTLARSLVEAGKRVGFYETDGLVTTEMYGTFDEALDNWTRSLPMKDRFSGKSGAIGLAEVLFVQALPFWRWLRGSNGGSGVIGWQLNRVLLMIRLGVLTGTARAYPDRPWAYWLSPLLDMPVALRLIKSSVRRTHTWRGRTITPGGAP